MLIHSKTTERDVAIYGHTDKAGSWEVNEGFSLEGAQFGPYVHGSKTLLNPSMQLQHFWHFNSH